ncbi:MAG: AEC family transporter [Armatimonas sp.]
MVLISFLLLAASLFYKIIAPMLLVISIGALAQRARPLDIATLSFLQVRVLLPAFLFVRLFESTLSGRQIATVAFTSLLIQLLLGVVVYLAGRLRRVSPSTLSATLLAATVFNAGNFGIPVAERAFGKVGGAVQACIVLAANLSLWAVGYALSAAIGGGKAGDAWDAIKTYFKLPMFWAMVAALALKGFHLVPPEPLLYPFRGMADTIVVLAQMTLGAQLMSQWRRPRWHIVLPVAALKLLGLPAMAALVVWALKLWPWPGALIIVAAAGPTAVNTMLLAMEQGNDVELAAECVFWTTLLSAITVTGVLTVVIALGGGPPP